MKIVATLSQDKDCKKHTNALGNSAPSLILFDLLKLVLQLHVLVGAAASALLKKHSAESTDLEDESSCPSCPSGMFESVFMRVV